MFDFRKLIKLLERELTYQEKLLNLLVRERAAIVKLEQEEIERLSEEKAAILAEASAVEEKRKQIFLALQAETGKEQLKFADVVAICPAQEGRGPLLHTGEKLKKIATSVREMNEQNAVLIKQSLGLILSALAIIRSSPETDLPTYTPAGKLVGGAEDPAFVARPPVTRQA